MVYQAILIFVRLTCQSSDERLGPEPLPHLVSLLILSYFYNPFRRDVFFSDVIYHIETHCQLSLRLLLSETTRSTTPKLNAFLYGRSTGTRTRNWQIKSLL